jgi:hypothetical protein
MLLAVLPSDPLLDTEQEAALAAGFDGVVRFRFLDTLEIVSVTPKRLKLDASRDDAHIGVFRGFMLRETRYRKLYRQFLDHGVRLVSSPEQYAAAHYFPSMLRTSLAALAPPTRVKHVVDDADSDADDAPAQKRQRNALLGSIRADFFADVAAEIQRDWAQSSPSGCVMLKDYVKSAKPHFLSVKHHDIAAACAELVHRRHDTGGFNRGVVIKQHVPLRSPRNEWRAWFVNGRLLGIDANSPDADTPAGMARVPAQLLDAVSRIIVDEMGALPFITADFAEALSGTFIILEIGDGGVSGPAVCTDLLTLWRGLKRLLGAPAPAGVAPPQASASSFVVDIHSKVNETRRLLAAARSQ